MARYSIAEISDRLNVGREVGRGFVKFCVEAGIAEHKGERKVVESRGTYEAVYEFIDDAPLSLAQKLTEALMGGG